MDFRHCSSGVFHILDSYKNKDKKSLPLLRTRNLSHPQRVCQEVFLLKIVLTNSDRRNLYLNSLQSVKRFFEIIFQVYFSAISHNCRLRILPAFLPFRRVAGKAPISHFSSFRFAFCRHRRYPNPREKGCY
jgi:hypothetical protein